MEFLLGVVAGFAVATLVVATVIYLRAPIERTLDVATKAIMLSGPRPKGYIFEPEPEEEEARRERIRENTEQGRDTTVEELR